MYFNGYNALQVSHNQAMSSKKYLQDGQECVPDYVISLLWWGRRVYR